MQICGWECIPENGPATGRIIDGKYVEKQVSEKKRMCQDEGDSPRSYEDRSPRNTKQQINKTVPRGRFFVSSVPRRAIGDKMSEI